MAICGKQGGRPTRGEGHYALKHPSTRAVVACTPKQKKTGPIGCRRSAKPDDDEPDGPGPRVLPSHTEQKDATSFSITSLSPV